MTVLLVDDDPRVRASLGALLSAEAGLEVVGAAASADAAVQRLAAVAPDVVLLDILLPDADAGLGLLRRLVGDHGCTVLAMSVRDGYRTAALAAGAAGYLAKDGRPEIIISALRAAARAAPRT